MNTAYLEELIGRLEIEMSKHDGKFAGNVIHASCHTRFKRTINELRAKLEQMRRDTLLNTIDSTVRGDEFDKVNQLQKLASSLETGHRKKESEQIKEKVRVMIAKELNEMNGFDR